MKKNLIVLFSIFLFSCSGGKEEIPTDILSKEKYISVMVDMYMLESRFSHANLIDRPAYDEGIEEYKKLFKKHGTDIEEVERSIDYYSHRPEEMKKIQMIILDSLNLRSKK